MRKITAIITGLIRHPQTFGDNLKILSSLRRSGLVDRIVFSTWESEFAKYPDLGPYLRQFGAEYIAAPEPKPTFENPGHLWHQLRSLELALRTVGRDDWVFKTRADLVCKEAFLDRLFRTEEAFAIPDRDPVAGMDNGSRTFRHRVWIPSFEITVPFYIYEHTFFGHRSDISRLTEYNAYSTLFGLQVAPETQRFLCPFVHEFPILYEFAEAASIFHGGSPRHQKDMALHVASDIYWEYIAVYFYVLCKYFYVTSGEANQEVLYFEQARAGDAQYVAPQFTTSKIDPTVFLANFDPARMTEDRIRCFDSGWLEAVFSGRVADPFIAESFLPSLARGFTYRDTNERRQALLAYMRTLQRPSVRHG